MECLKKTIRMEAMIDYFGKILFPTYTLEHAFLPKALHLLLFVQQIIFENYIVFYLIGLILF